jgi:hypothetical protein
MWNAFSVAPEATTEPQPTSAWPATFSRYCGYPNVGLCPVKSPTWPKANAVTPAIRPDFNATSSLPVVMPATAAAVRPTTQGTKGERPADRRRPDLDDRAEDRVAASFAAGDAALAARRVLILRQFRTRIGRLEHPNGPHDVAIIQRGNELADGETRLAIVCRAAAHVGLSSQLNGDAEAPPIRKTCRRTNKGS